ncbi:MAG: hypothetical protein KBA30_08240, partial [Clostridia bacterium]|nr:hypothetical protein [Clostridia bacterium]
ACPAGDRPACIAPDKTFVVEKAPFYPLTVEQNGGGIHGTHCLRIHNFEVKRPCGVAQDGKRLRPGARYRFRGWLRSTAGEPAEAEIRFYATEGIDWAQPLAVIPLGPVPREGRTFETVFENTDFDGWATFSLFVSPGADVLADAFSLMPEDTDRGWKHDVIAGLKRVNPGVIRFPGGCFASLHDWRDGIGPRDTRKPEPSYFWGDINYNDVGTDEFLQLCERVGCEAMLVVNMFHPKKRFLFSDTEDGFPPAWQPHGFDLPHVTDIRAGIECARQWVEYCNGDAESTAMGRLRAANGHPAPYNIKYWEMDNETYRWFGHVEYAETIIEYSKAMKSVDPSIHIGVCSYHGNSSKIERILEICGEHVEFLADRICEPENIARKIGIVREYNARHEHQIYYTDSEALQNRPGTLAPYTRWFYDHHGITIREARRTWIYGLTLVGNLMNYHRYGGIVRFMCFNNLCNTSGQSCIEVSKEETMLPICGLLFERMSRSEAAWALRIEGYEPDSLKSVEIQAAWNADESRLIVYLLNKCGEDTRVSLDFSALGRTFRSIASTRMSASGGRVQETMRSQGNIRVEHGFRAPSATCPDTFGIPAFSFTELVLE